MITPEFELLCYAIVVIGVLYARHNPFSKQAPVVQTVEPVITPIVEPVIPASNLTIEEAHTIMEVLSTSKFHRKRPAAKGFTPSVLTIPVESIAPILPIGWDLDKNGNPLRGSALAGRKRKLGITDGN